MARTAAQTAAQKKAAKASAAKRRKRKSTTPKMDASGKAWVGKQIRGLQQAKQMAPPKGKTHAAHVKAIDSQIRALKKRLG